MKCRSPRPVMRFRFFGIGVKRRPPFANFAKGGPPRMPVLITSRYYLKVVTSKIIRGEGIKRDPPAGVTLPGELEEMTAVKYQMNRKPSSLLRVLIATVGFFISVACFGRQKTSSPPDVT